MWASHPYDAARGGNRQVDGRWWRPWEAAPGWRRCLRSASVVSVGMLRALHGLPGSRRVVLVARDVEQVTHRVEGIDDLVELVLDKGAEVVVARVGDEAIMQLPQGRKLARIAVARPRRECFHGCVDGGGELRCRRDASVRLRGTGAQQVRGLTHASQCSEHSRGLLRVDAVS